ncbi:ribosomal-protein-serine acetyltransferase [Sinobacterium caligoides]|uniref:Ribosomal-protein-serine acetyltransferase n=1 Tax=Sinobacterium caligoides TaxID=933926 RepID=A0A3N2DP23_9GAMM|nr:GNAT family protein [Sinobacterium caligoides]ROS01075.1 ribosomal-protein-serine acetyltransferase [Sinobacterium caligoides]
MFKLSVDEEINLYLVSESFTDRYVVLVEENRDYLSEWLEWPRFCKTQSDFSAFVRASLHRYADGAGMNCAIEYRGEIVGSSGFNSINQLLKVAEIGYWLGEQYQGHGIITRVCRYLIDYALTELAMEKVQIAVAESNVSSRAVCERLNMRLEGVITNREKVGDKILDHAIYAIRKGGV